VAPEKRNFHARFFTNLSFFENFETSNVMCQVENHFLIGVFQGFPGFLRRCVFHRRSEAARYAGVAPPSSDMHSGVHPIMLRATRTPANGRPASRPITGGTQKSVSPAALALKA
jgi:hypothetical protein